MTAQHTLRNIPMEQSLEAWATEARMNGNRTDQPDDLAARWFDLADDLDAAPDLLKAARLALVALERSEKERGIRHLETVAIRAAIAKAEGR